MSAQLDNAPVSPVTLGTAQFGMNYGIASYGGEAEGGEPSTDQAAAIISEAHDKGVISLDTAAAYGSSEDVLGDVLQQLQLQRRMTVITKVGCDPDASAADADEAIEQAVRRSCRRLRLEALPCCLLHHEDQAPHFAALKRCRELGLVRHAGISVATPAGALRAVSTDGVEALQIPLNILDRRFFEAGVLDTVTARGITLFARSAFLQGLLVMPEERIIPELQEIIPVRRRLQSLAAEAGIGMPELAVRYVLSVPAVASLVMGVDDIDQLRQNLALTKRGALDKALIEAADKAVPRVSDYLLNPPRWPNAKGNDKYQAPDGTVTDLREAEHHDNHRR